MSRVAKKPIELPAGVEISFNGQLVTVKGSKGTLSHQLNKSVAVNQDGNVLTFGPQQGAADGWVQAGTARAVINNMVTGVSKGFERKLELNGVGYRAAVKGNVLALNLGFSHPVEHELPAGVTAECPTQTEVLLKGIDKELLGQVAAEIRRYRKPEPYKGKGVRYAGEVVRQKEAKKK